MPLSLSGRIQPPFRFDGYLSSLGSLRNISGYPAKLFSCVHDAGLKPRSTIKDLNYLRRSEIWRLQMTAIARVFSYRFSEARFELDSLKTICLFCGIGLTASLLLAAHGIDLNPGFF